MSNYETSIKNIIDGILDIGGGQILDKRYVSLSGLLTPSETFFTLYTPLILVLLHIHDL